MPKFLDPDELARRACRLEFRPEGAQIERVIPASPIDCPSVEFAVRYLFVTMFDTPDYAQCASLYVEETLIAEGESQLRGLARRLGSLPCIECRGSGFEKRRTRVQVGAPFKRQSCSVCGGKGFPKRSFLDHTATPFEIK